MIFSSPECCWDRVEVVCFSGVAYFHQSLSFCKKYSQGIKLVVKDTNGDFLCKSLNRCPRGFHWAQLQFSKMHESWQFLYCCILFLEFEIFCKRGRAPTCSSSKLMPFVSTGVHVCVGRLDQRFTHGFLKIFKVREFLQVFDIFPRFWAISEMQQGHQTWDELHHYCL